MSHATRLKHDDEMKTALNCPVTIFLNSYTSYQLGKFASNPVDRLWRKFMSDYKALTSHAKLGSLWVGSDLV